jgi:hypothetical protein
VQEGSLLAINHLGGKLWLDGCLGVEPRESVIAKNSLRPKEHHFAGRFPSRPLVLLIIISSSKREYGAVLQLQFQEKTEVFGEFLVPM